MEEWPEEPSKLRNNTPMFRAASNNFNDCSFSFWNEWEKEFLMTLMLHGAKLSNTFFGGSGMIDYASHQANGLLSQLQSILG